jgi:hypothetical protein
MNKSVRKPASKVAKTRRNKTAARPQSYRNHLSKSKVKDPMTGHGASRQTAGRGAPTPNTEDSASAAKEFPDAIYQDGSRSGR